MLSLGDALICLTQVQLISFIILFIRTLKNKNIQNFLLGNNPIFIRTKT